MLHMAKYHGNKLPNTLLTMEVHTTLGMQPVENVGTNYKRDCEFFVLQSNVGYLVDAEDCKID
jgi:hypothetical protein